MTQHIIQPPTPLHEIAFNHVQYLVLGNWKMNASLAKNRELLLGIRQGLETMPKNVLLGVCPPFPYLAQVSEWLTNTYVAIGAQDVSEHEQGAYTSEVSASMLLDFKCRFALVGHSERRHFHAETSQSVANKAFALVKAGIIPVVCVGETLEQHQANEQFTVIAEQLEPVLALGAECVNKMVIAYEPVWAIGTGLSASPDQAQQVHAFIRSLLDKLNASKIKILYGGSVKAQNATSLFAMPDINGALVGGASLQACEFLAIAQATTTI